MNGRLLHCRKFGQRNFVSNCLNGRKLSIVRNTSWHSMRYCSNLENTNPDSQWKPTSAEFDMHQMHLAKQKVFEAGGGWNAVPPFMIYWMGFLVISSIIGVTLELRKKPHDIYGEENTVHH